MNTLLGLLGALVLLVGGSSATQAPGAPGGLIRHLAPGGGVLLVKADGSVVTWGRLPAGMIQAPEPVPLPDKARRGAVAGSNLGKFTGYALLEDGTVVAWGSNDEGLLGNGPPGASVPLGVYPKPSALPVRVTGLKDIVEVSAGDRHALALRNDGTVWAWGSRDDGALGDGDTKPAGSVRVLSANAAVRVPGLDGVTAIAAGARHSLALTRDGRVFAWGANGVGELGIGTTVTGWTPVQVPALDGVVSIAAGSGGNSGGVSGALRADGTVWMWGTNNSAMIGNSRSATEPDGEAVLHAVPEQVRGLTGVQRLAIGAGHVAVVLSDGSLRMWGHNGYGQIGIGTAGPYVPRPTRVPALTSVAAVYLGTMRSYAVRTDGTLWVWGFKQLDRGILSKNLHTPTRLDMP